MWDKILPSALRKIIVIKLSSIIKQIVNSEYLLSQLYANSNSDKDNESSIEYMSPYKTQSIGEDQGLPIPPLGNLTMYYGSSAKDYLSSGQSTASWIKSLIKKHGFIFDENSSTMEWGCTTGRVLRCFAEEAKKSEIWGTDIDFPSISWAKANLAPIFHFLCTSSYPHLPFPDHKFSLIYGISVMTHMVHFRDMWLMELNRILQDNGLLILTVHDEHTVERLLDEKRTGSLQEFFCQLLENVDLEQLKSQEVTVVQGKQWSGSFTFFKTDYIKREWGQYFEILDIQPYAEGNRQSAVVMRKYSK